LQGSDMPKDGKVYEQGSYIGKSRVVYFGVRELLKLTKLLPIPFTITTPTL